MKNYRNTQVYIGREEIDYVAYKCLDEEFQIIPIENPEDYKENDFIQRAENKEVTIPNWICKVYDLDHTILENSMDENRIVHCRAKKRMEFQIPKQTFIDHTPKGKMTSLGVYEAKKTCLRLPYVFFEESMVTVHKYNDYIELAPILVNNRKNLPYLEGESTYETLQDYYGKSLQNLVGACYFYRNVGNKLPLPAQFSRRKFEVFVTDADDHRVYLIPVDSVSASETSAEKASSQEVDDSIMRSLNQILESSRLITQKYEETKKMKEEIEQKQKELEELKTKMIEILK